MRPALSIRDLSKRYGSLEAVSGIGFDVGEGEIFGLIGPNGAGKTTTLECILGLLPPDSGSIMVKGIDAIRHPAEAKAILGAQLQDSALPDAMTPCQALKLCAAFYPRPAAPADLLERFQLTEKADARFASLSGGQRQRLALALAFVSQPEIVVLDEPTAGLDPPARRELHGLIAAQRDAGRALLFTTHYLEEARALCDRVAMIDRGRLVALDKPEALIAQSGGRPRIAIRTSPPLPGDLVRALPAVVSVRDGGLVETTAPTSTLIALTALAEQVGAEIEDIQVQKPTLDDAFMNLTEGTAPDSPGGPGEQAHRRTRGMRPT